MATTILGAPVKPWQRSLANQWPGNPISGQFRPKARREHLRWWQTVCQATGCRRQGEPCRFSVHEEPVYYCTRHDSGFCRGCGVFWGGVESFDYSRAQLCENCEAEYRADDDYDEDDDWDDGHDYWENY